jgi:hypothetical protein
VVKLVALSHEAVDPSAIVPAAFILSREGLLQVDEVTFGSNYDLDVRSFELERGYARAVDGGWLILRSQKVAANRGLLSESGDGTASTRAAELFSLPSEQLMRMARHYLLDERGDRDPHPSWLHGE